jgi:hypothetical protein
MLKEFARDPQYNGCDLLVVRAISETELQELQNGPPFTPNELAALQLSVVTPDWLAHNNSDHAANLRDLLKVPLETGHVGVSYVVWRPLPPNKPSETKIGTTVHMFSACVRPWLKGDATSAMVRLVFESMMKSASGGRSG